MTISGIPEVDEPDHLLGGGGDVLPLLLGQVTEHVLALPLTRVPGHTTQLSYLSLPVLSLIQSSSQNYEVNRSFQGMEESKTTF